MNIVIAGAGDVGFHLAELLVTENQNITIIDTDERLLDYAAKKLDILTIKGDVASIETLQEANVNNASLFIAVTTYDSTNLLVGILAKKMGARQTIARVSHPEYLHENQVNTFNEAGIDYLFSPTMLAAEEIGRLIRRVSATDVIDFEQGQISIIGFTADNQSHFYGQSFGELNADAKTFHTKIIAVLRNEVTFIPLDNDRVLSGDHIYLATGLNNFEKINDYIGKELIRVNRIMIVGKTELALETAKQLEKEYAVTVVIPDEKNCKKFSGQLKRALVIEGDANNTDLLLEEGLEQMDAFVALTPNSETNIISSLMAEKVGVYKTIALVNNSTYTKISQNIGIDTIINKKILAANEIFRFVRKGHVEAIASFHGVDAEMIEFTVHKNNRVTKHSIVNLQLPKDAIVAGVVRKQAGIIPDKDFMLEINDKVVVFALPHAIKKVEEIFR